MQQILIVDDEKDFARGLARLISQGLPELRVEMAHTGAAALEHIESQPVAVMLLDLNMPGMHGMEVIAEVSRKNPAMPIVVLTAYGTVETAVAALKQGAWDFLTKPVRREDLLRCLAKALEHNRLKGENQRLKQVVASSGLERALIGDSPVMVRLRDNIRAVASTSYTVLIRGESGTGKELVAEAIHTLSNRQPHPFLKVNCPAIPEQLLESELFGHAKGAFTGATSAHKGMFVQAAAGTLMLDEVGDIPLSVQTKLLRALQDGEVRPVGAGRATRVDTRIVAATNQDLEEKIRRGLFREDLFYRLNVLTITAPSLKERKQDIPLLAAYFFAQARAEIGLEAKTLSAGAMASLTQRDWPGNVRELQNFIRRQVVFSRGAAPEPEEIFWERALEKRESGEDDPAMTYKESKEQLLDAFTRNYMTTMLQRTGGNISEAARLSGLERVSLQKILRRLGMDGADFRK